MPRPRSRSHRASHREFALVEERLRSEPPTLDEAGMERLLHQCLRFAEPKKAAMHRMRIAMVATLMLGFSFSGAGAGLAISGIGDGQTSAEQQYSSPTTGSGTLGATTRKAPAREAPTQETRQLSADSSSSEALPFTGWAAAPVVLLGLLLLGAGLHLRRNLRRA